MTSLPAAGEPAFYAAGPQGREGPMTQEDLAARRTTGKLLLDPAA